MNARDIQCLVETLDSAQIREFEYTCGSDRLHVSFFETAVCTTHAIPMAENSGEPASVPSPAVAPKQSVSVRSQRVGIFCRTHPLVGMPPPKVGDTVTAARSIGYIRIGQVFWAVPAPHDGTLSRLVAQDESVAGYGDVLFEIQPND